VSEQSFGVLAHAQTYILQASVEWVTPQHRLGAAGKLQLIELGGDADQLRMLQFIALQAEVDVRAGLMVASRPGAERNHPFHVRMGRSDASHRLEFRR